MARLIIYNTRNKLFIFQAILKNHEIDTPTPPIDYLLTFINNFHSLIDLKVLLFGSNSTTNPHSPNSGTGGLKHLYSIYTLRDSLTISKL